MKIYAMSDIHGCLQEFEAALDLVDLSGDNKLILLGDYIHSGADSYGVLKKIITELIDLMLKLVSDKRRIRILKTIKCSSWQAENGITAGELLQKADIRIPTKKELETVNIFL